MENKIIKVSIGGVECQEPPNGVTTQWTGKHSWEGLRRCHDESEDEWKARLKREYRII